MPDWKVTLTITASDVRIEPENISLEDGLIAALTTMRRRLQAEDAHPLVQDILRLSQSIDEELRGA